MAWVTLANVESSITTAAAASLGLGSASVFAQYEAQARATVISVMQSAGYSPPTAIDVADGLSGSFLGKLTAALIIREAYQYRKGVRLPFDPSGTISEGLFLLDAVQNKRLPIPGMEPDTLGGIGGNEGAPADGPTAPSNAFGPGKLGGF